MSGPISWKQRLEQVHVDDLADARVQRRPSWRRRRRAPVTSSVSAIGGSSGPAVGLAVDRREAAHRLGDGGEPRSRRVRAVLAEAGDAGDHEPRVAASSTSGPRPRRSSVPGRKFSMSTSASSQRRCITSRSSGALRSSAIVRLLRPAELPPERHAVARVAPAHVAQRVAAVGPLDLDHVGAEVGEVAGARRAGDHRRRVDDPQVRERPRDRCGGRLVGHPKTLKPSGSKARPPSDRISTSGSATFAMISVVRATASLPNGRRVVERVGDVERVDGELDDPGRQVVDEQHAAEARAADGVVGLALDAVDDAVRRVRIALDRIIAERGTRLATRAPPRRRAAPASRAAARACSSRAASGSSPRASGRRGTARP